MEVKYKPKFKRDLLNLRGKKEINVHLLALINQMKTAQIVSQLPGYKPLDKYKTRLRIKIKIGNNENYRLGLIIKGNTIWMERILPRPNFYRYYRR